MIETTTITISTNKLNNKSNEKTFATKLILFENSSALLYNKNIINNYGKLKNFNKSKNFDKNITLFSNQLNNKLENDKFQTQLNIKTITTNKTINKFINETNTNNYKTEFLKTSKNTNDNLTIINNPITKNELNNKDKKRWRQNSSKKYMKNNFCKLKNKIICKYGCISEEK